jgi:hypothetical protein
MKCSSRPIAYPLPAAGSAADRPDAGLLSAAGVMFEFEHEPG